MNLGIQYLVEYYGCSPRLINNSDFLRQSMLEAAAISKANIVTDIFHTFNPIGLSGVVVISESHFAVHTWPEHGVVSLDIFSCSSSLEIDKGIQHLFHAFAARDFKVTCVKRGEIPELQDAYV